MIFVFSLILVLSSLLFITSLGYITIKTNHLDNCENLSSILGFSIIALFCNLLYFLFDFNTEVISIILIIIFIISLALCIFLYLKAFIKVFFKVVILSFPILFFFLVLAHFYGEQFYVFRGNYYDHFNYIANGLAMSSYKYSEISKLHLAITQDFPYQSLNLNTRPVSALMMSLFYKFRLLDIFYQSYLFKIFLLTIISTSFLFFLNIVENTLKSFKKFYFISLTFALSFWTIWIFEIDSLPQLSSMSVFICCVSLTLHLDKYIRESHYGFLTIYVLTISSMFILYPEICAIYFLIAAVYFLIFKKLNFEFYIKNINKIIFILFSFFVLTLPNYEGTYKYLIETAVVNGTSQLNNFWGYYGAFVLGRENAILNQEAILSIKSLYLYNPGIIELLSSITQINFENDYWLFPVNIIPSVLGFYFLSVSKGLSFITISHGILLIILSFYLFYKIIKNLNILINSSSNFFLLLKSALVIFILLSMFLVFKGTYWSIIKMYFYLSPFIFLIIFCNFNNQTTKFVVLSPSYLLILLMLFFPIYKFGTFNSGIGRLDSFPSIIDKNKKQKFLWELNKKKILDCDHSFLKINDFITLKYVAIKLSYYNKNFFTNKILKGYIPLVIDDNKKKFILEKQKKVNCLISTTDKNILVDKI